MLCFEGGDGVAGRIEGAAAETAGCLRHKTLGQSGLLLNMYLKQWDVLIVNACRRTVAGLRYATKPALTCA